MRVGHVPRCACLLSACPLGHSKAAMTCQCNINSLLCISFAQLYNTVDWFVLKNCTMFSIFNEWAIWLVAQNAFYNTVVQGKSSSFILLYKSKLYDARKNVLQHWQPKLTHVKALKITQYRPFRCPLPLAHDRPIYRKCFNLFSLRKLQVGIWYVCM